MFHWLLTGVRQSNCFRKCSKVSGILPDIFNYLFVQNPSERLAHCLFLLFSAWNTREVAFLVARKVYFCRNQAKLCHAQAAKDFAFQINCWDISISFLKPWKRDFFSLYLRCDWALGYRLTHFNLVSHFM